MNKFKKPFVYLLFLLLLFGCSRFSLCETDRTKILLIGLDGATWKVIKPLVKEGKLSNISYLMREGAYGNLESLSPLVSPAIWTSIATGKGPEKHGILDWAFYNDRLKMVEPFRSYHRKTKAIWNILSENKKEIIIYRWLVTYPPEKINGFLISDYFENDLPVTCPEELSDVIKKIPHTKKKSDFKFDSKRDEKIYKSLCDLNRDFENIIWLQKNNPADFFACYIVNLDTIQHFFWKFMEPEYFKEKLWNLTEEDIAKYKNVIKDFYEEIDGLIGRLIENIDKRTIVIIVSDHGFHRIALPTLNGALSFNRILSETGLLEFKEDSTSPDPLKSKVLSYEHRDNLGHYYYHITINVPNKKSYEFNELKNKVINLISNIRLAGGGMIYRIADDKVGEGDLIIERVNALDNLNSDLYINGNKYPIANFIDLIWKDISGDHDRYDGVIIIYDKPGKRIIKGKEINAASVLDITPTVLYLMGLSIGKDMDGKVLTAAIEPRYLKKNPVRFAESYDKNKFVHFDNKEERLNSYDEALFERLKTLGYMQ